MARQPLLSAHKKWSVALLRGGKGREILNYPNESAAGNGAPRWPKVRVGSSTLGAKFLERR